MSTMANINPPRTHRACFGRVWCPWWARCANLTKGDRSTNQVSRCVTADVKRCQAPRAPVPRDSSMGCWRCEHTTSLAGNSVRGARSWGIKAGIRFICKMAACMHACAIAQLSIFQEGSSLVQGTGKACPRVLPLQNLCRGLRVCSAARGHQHRVASSVGGLRVSACKV
jgi:hypothetical protein